LALVLFVWAPVVFTQTSALPPPSPLEPVTGILEAFRTNHVVAMTDPHGNEQVQAFLLSVIRDPRFSSVANDIVIETASARYQDAVDRFVRGDDVPAGVIRKAWEEHTVPNSLGVQAEELIRAVRTVNAGLATGRRLRVLAGDPPIDWENIVTPADHRRWIELRDSYPADLVRRQVLDRGRRALVIYGQGHLQRAQIVSNYDMSTWEAQTLVSLLERDPGVRLFNVWTLLDRDEAMPEGVASWRVPSLAIVRGTTLGARDFGLYSSLIGGTRVSVRNGQFDPLPRDEWKMRRMEDQFDALLYLGPPAAFTNVTIRSTLCHDSEFIANRLRRLKQFGPPVEVENLKRACGL
jgi:hypothetical protein